MTVEAGVRGPKTPLYGRARCTPAAAGKRARCTPNPQTASGAPTSTSGTDTQIRHFISAGSAGVRCHPHKQPVKIVHDALCTPGEVGV